MAAADNQCGESKCLSGDVKNLDAISCFREIVFSEVDGAKPVAYQSAR